MLLFEEAGVEGKNTVFIESPKELSVRWKVILLIIRGAFQWSFLWIHLFATLLLKII